MLAWITHSLLTFLIIMLVNGVYNSNTVNVLGHKYVFGPPQNSFYPSLYAWARPKTYLTANINPIVIILYIC